MIYSKICPACGKKSENTEQFCTECGAEKQENLKKTSLIDSITIQLAEKIDFFDNPVLIVVIFYRVLILLGVIFLIPEFIRDSELFWIACAVYSVFGIIKQLDEYILNLKGIYTLSKIFLLIYIGAAIGNFIFHVGRNYTYTFSDYFNPMNMWSEAKRGNPLLYVGMVAGITSYYFIKFIFSYLKEDE